MKETILHATITCGFCLKRKDAGQPKITKKGLFSEYPFQKVFIDLTGPLPVTKAGNKYILAIIDGFSKWSALIPPQVGSLKKLEMLF